MSNKDKHSNLNKRLSMVAILTSFFACVGVIYFASILLNEFYKPETNQTLEQPLTAKQGDKPLSIIPLQPDGVTILNKQAEFELNKISPSTPLSAPSQVVSGYAMEVGTALSFNELSTKFSKIANANGLENFNALEPRAVLAETVNGLQAKLLIGPFENESLAKEACDILILADDKPCSVQIFEGELIARE